jgi:pimeloyl-ACP methyl ester carboxylesterase
MASSNGDLQMSGQPTLLLVHGSWHGGSSWAGVQAHLASAGVRSLAPTLPGHQPGADRSRVTHDDYVASVLDALTTQPGVVVLVGHSFGGSVISRVALLQPERCQALIYYSAFVPRDGERVADSLPPGMVEFLNDSADASPDRSIALPYDRFRHAFANTADDATAEALFELLVPEPHAPIFEPLTLPSVDEPAPPAAYIHCRHDRTMPPGTFYPGQSSRLREPTMIEIDGDHETLLTAPGRLAATLLDALGAMHGRTRR